MIIAHFTLSNSFIHQRKRNQDGQKTKWIINNTRSDNMKTNVCVGGWEAWTGASKKRCILFIPHIMMFSFTQLMHSTNWVKRIITLIYNIWGLVCGFTFSILILIFNQQKYNVVTRDSDVRNNGSYALLDNTLALRQIKTLVM